MKDDLHLGPLFYSRDLGFLSEPRCFHYYGSVHNFKSFKVISLALFFLFKIALAMFGLLCFHFNFNLFFFYIYEECHLDIYLDCTESVDHFWQDGYLHNNNPLISL